MTREGNGWGSERGQNDFQKRMWRLRKEGEVQSVKGVESQRRMGSEDRNPERRLDLDMRVQWLASGSGDSLI